jgi:hypothetical protein
MKINISKLSKNTIDKIICSVVNYLIEKQNESQTDKKIFHKVWTSFDNVSKSITLKKNVESVDISILPKEIQIAVAEKIIKILEEMIEIFISNALYYDKINFFGYARLEEAEWKKESEKLLISLNKYKKSLSSK